MAQNSNYGITSKVSGIINKDIIAYLLPGGLFLLSLCLIFGIFPWFFIILSVCQEGDNTTIAIIITLLLPSLSYLAGLFISFVRLYIHRVFQNNLTAASLGKLIYGALPEVMKRTRIPIDIRQNALKKIQTT